MKRSVWAVVVTWNRRTLLERCLAHLIAQTRPCDGVVVVDNASDDGTAQCVKVWVNELRLTDFDQEGGWAALARVNTTLADLGTLSVAGNYSTPYWGSIDKRVSERQRDTRYGIDVSANLEMGKFLQRVGRRKLIMPTYTALVATPDGLVFAEEVFAKAKPGYHPITTGSVEGVIAKAKTAIPASATPQAEAPAGATTKAKPTVVGSPVKPPLIEDPATPPPAGTATPTT